MTFEINETHDANLKSWIESANAPATDFPLQNLPFCVFTRACTYENVRIGVAIGDFVLDVYACYECCLFDDESFNIAVNADNYCLDHSVMKKNRELQSAFRRRLTEILSDKADEQTRKLVERNLIPITEVEFHLPAHIGDYTDFYCSIFHATNVGAMFRPDNPLLPNYKYIPIGYHGRASSIVISGTDIKRPKGQTRPDAEQPPSFIPCKNLDYEMEVGFFVGRGNELGESIPIESAEEHIFGLCLVNDWSARDIQAWEYQPLGPFLAKNFATSLSPFVVTMEALAPFRVPAFERDAEDPQPLDYLSDEQNKKSGGFDINLEVYIQTPKMREENIEPFLLSRSNMKDLYWTIGQMLTHHASNGCNLQTGDLMATGTVSGKEKTERGCLLELTWRGKEPIELPGGEQRRFLEDGDEIIMKGFCEREGFRRIGFGECRGRILPAD
ncbi:MAG TPA: fumarylacetoacetase [Pyrinomonadaceae bacterium]|jgi:fumarylacetoacetase|nr:fumarylacetoacetase [Pyrinomonadaceae bacterium]